MMVSGVPVSQLTGKDKPNYPNMPGAKSGFAASHVGSGLENYTSTVVRLVDVCGPGIESTKPREDLLNFFQVKLNAAQSAVAETEKAAAGTKATLNEMDASEDPSLYQYMQRELTQREALAVDARAFATETAAELSPRIAQLTAALQSMRVACKGA